MFVPDQLSCLHICLSQRHLKPKYCTTSLFRSDSLGYACQTTKCITFFPPRFPGYDLIIVLQTRYLGSTPKLSRSMAVWYNLPAEVRQNILDHLLDGLLAKFEPRHAATRSTRNTSTQQYEDGVATGPPRTDSVASVLLISKKFVTYNEVEGALLSNAKIVLRDYRTLNALETRYGADGLAMMQEVMVDANKTRREIRESRTKYPDLHQYLRTKMFNVRRVFVSLSGWVGGPMRQYLSHDEAITIAQGEQLVAPDASSRGGDWGPFHGTTDATAVARKLLQSMLSQFLRFIITKQDRWVTKLLDVEAYEHCEIVVEWKVMSFVSERDAYGTQPQVSCTWLHDRPCTDKSEGSERAIQQQEQMRGPTKGR